MRPENTGAKAVIDTHSPLLPLCGEPFLTDDAAAHKPPTLSGAFFLCTQKKKIKSDRYIFFQ